MNISKFHVLFGGPLYWSLEPCPAVESMDPSLASYMIGRLWSDSMHGKSRTEQEMEGNQHMKLRRFL